MNYEKIYRSPINTSISKHLYSVPKNKRFQPSLQSPCKRDFYNISGSLISRTTNFGIGGRSRLENITDNPPVGSYESVITSRKRGFSFANKKKTGFIDQGILNKAYLPGPGNYSQLNNPYKTSYTIRSKYEDPLQKHKNQLGPGQYEVKGNLSKTGNYFNSKYKGSGCGKIGNTKRFDSNRELAPGPGKYQITNKINKAGIYIDSKFPTNKVYQFEKTPRPPFAKQGQAPPPGTYYVFSEFAPRRTFSTHL